MAEWKATEEVELEEEIEEHRRDDLEEIVVEANEGEMLTLNTYHPPRSNEHLGLLVTFHEPPNLFPIPPISQTLKQTFCQSVPESLLEAPNPELRACEEMVRSKSKESSTRNTQISKGKEKKKVSKFRGDLFDWLILF